MKKILCPIDFSLTADHALATAAKVAQECDAQLELINIQSLLTMTPSEILMGTNMKIAGTVDQLEVLSSEISRIYKISCYSDVKSSNYSVAAAISEVGDVYDLVIMGTNGANHIYDSLFGTTSYQVAKSLSSPVLLLPPDYDYQGFSSILYVMDSGEIQLPPEHLLKWANLFGANITWFYNLANGLINHKEMDILESQIVEISGDPSSKFKTCYNENKIQGILDSISDDVYDFIALRLHQEHFVEKVFHKNIIKNLCAMAPGPLFIFQDYATISK